MKLNTILLAAGMLIVGLGAGYFISKSMGGHEHDHDHGNSQVQIDQQNKATQNPFEQQKDPLANAKPAGPTTSFAFEKMEHDFGTITQGDKVEYVFKFKNTGDEPLVIESAKGSCGCTVPKWPQGPIPPGEENEIKVEYDSKGKSNQEVKTVTIMANTEPAVTRLTIKAFVEVPAGAEASSTIKQ